MPDKWSAERHERIFYVLIDQYKINTKDISDGWKKRYPNDKDIPTAGALDQHIAKARKANGGGKAPTKTMSKLPASTANTPKTLATPKTPRTQRTPASGEKRKRKDESEGEMSDEDESEPELSKARLSEGLGRRASIPRRGKDSTKKYSEESSDEEDEDEGEGETAVEGDDAGDDAKMANATNGFHGLKEFVNFDGTGEEESIHLAGATPQKKTKRAMRDNSPAMSNVSTFSATFS